MLRFLGLYTRHVGSGQLSALTCFCSAPLLCSQYRAKVDSCLPAYLDYIVLPPRMQCYAWWRQRLVSRQLDTLR